MENNQFDLGPLENVPNNEGANRQVEAGNETTLPETRQVEVPAPPATLPVAVEEALPAPAVQPATIAPPAS